MSDFWGPQQSPGELLLNPAHRRPMPPPSLAVEQTVQTHIIILEQVTAAQE